MLERLKDWASSVERDVHALYLAARDPRVPWYAKAVAASIVAYALSPIDLIPDFVPILGYLDDLIIVPIGILLAIRLIPENIMSEHRAAAIAAENRPITKAGAIAVIGIWIVGMTACAYAAWRYLIP